MSTAGVTSTVDLRAASPWSHLLLLLSLAGLLFFLNLGGIGLTDRDEGRNAEAGREMFETGDWISPTFNYEPRYAKPVLLYWLMSLSYRLFGVSEFAARFPSAVFGVALILLQYAFLRRWRGTPVDLFSGLMLLLNVEIIGLGRMALTDSVLVFFTTLALYGFWSGLHASTDPGTGLQGSERHVMWLFYVGMALATLTKGPVGVVVPLLTAALYLTWTKRWGQFWRHGFPMAGVLVFALLALPWYAAMLAIHGSAYTASAQANTVGRFLNPMEGHSFTVLFYIPVLLFGFFPWSALLPFALHAAFRDWREARGTPSRELELFAALWVAGVFLFFTLSSTRLPHYIAPLFPAAAVLTASYWHRCVADPATRGARASIHVMMGLGYTLALGLAALPPLYSTFAETIAKEFPAATEADLGIGPYAAATILVVGMALVGYFGLWETRRAGAFWAAGASIALVGLIAIQVSLPRLSRYFIAPPQELAFTAGLNLGPQDRLILYGPPRPSAVFYARRKAIVIHPGEEENIRPYLKEPGRTMILLPARLKSKLPEEAADYPVILQRYGYLLLANEPMVKVPAAQPPPDLLRIPGH
ncbi:MAG TPA: glycosyltransferase family 39 protein [Nitrospiraceae bacterium]|nr:glycosyltransferase family 39 protein [Nitrospiraceae bacterium]